MDITTKIILRLHTPGWGVVYYPRTDMPIKKEAQKYASMLKRFNVPDEDIVRNVVKFMQQPPA